MEKYNMLALSTAHISENTAELMDNNAVGIPIYEKENYGWFIYVPGEYELENEIDKDVVPADLLECLRFARKEGCDWLMFDRDVEPIAELPQYS